jgi:hypothetical protein
MPRLVYRAAAATLAAAALAATAAALAPAGPESAGRALFDSLMVLRDGHGAWSIAQTEEPSRRNP